MAENQGGGAGESFLRRDLATLKKDVDGKFEQIMATSVAHIEAIADIWSVFRQFMYKSDLVDDGSSSITQSVLENWESHGLNDVAPARLVLNFVKKIVQVDAGPSKKRVAIGEKGPPDAVEDSQRHGQSSGSDPLL